MSLKNENDDWLEEIFASGGVLNSKRTVNKGNKLIKSSIPFATLRLKKKKWYKIVLMFFAQPQNEYQSFQGPHKI